MPVAGLRGQGASSTTPAMPALPTAYTDKNALGDAAKAAMLATLDAKGIRLLPYPFDSALAVVSDIDASCKVAIQNYVGTLVRRLGFDFGDSIWLTSSIEEGDFPPAGQGFLNADFTGRPEEHDEATVPLYTLAEAVAEYHRGNVDHLHAFTQAGPRVLILRPVTREECSVTVKMPDLQNVAIERAEALYAFGVSVAGRFAEDCAAPRISVLSRNGSIDRSLSEADRFGIADRQQINLVSVAPAAGPSNAIPVYDIAEIQVVFSSPEVAATLDQLLVVTAPRALLLDRLRWLRERQAVGMTLITEHAGKHFRTKGRTEKFDTELAETIRASDAPNAHNGRYIDEAGRTIFSTDADDLESVSRVLPDLVQDHDVRFIVPAAATSPLGWPVVDLVTPTSTRAGGDIYWANRTKPNLTEPEGKRKFDSTRTRHSTFTQRIEKVLQGTIESPGGCWPIYTHLGGTDTGQHVMPEPYFDDEHLLALQDRVFGITRQRARGHRIWFTRASTLYDYALAIRSIGDHVERPDANTVAITSWHDATLDKRMPTCAAQLYGLTFAVDDAAEARVTLDGVPIETLYRNRRTAGGGASVTIAETGLRWPVVGKVDPVAAIRDVAVAGDWTWRDETGVGRLAATDDGLASLRLPLDGRQAEGSQALSVDVCRDADALFGITVETTSGAQFFFGDRPVAVKLGIAFAAEALVHPRMRRDGERQRHAFAFHDLAWAAGAEPGGALPNHSLAAVTLWTLARPGKGATFADVAFLRPHTRRGGDDFCLAGLAAGAFGSTVEAVRVAGDGVPETTSVDAHGHFCFGVLPPGAYQVRNLDAGATWVDTTRAIIDLSAHVVDLRLTRAEESGGNA